MEGPDVDARVDARPTSLEPIVDGTSIVQTYQVLHVAPGLDRVYWLLIKAHRDRRAALADDLDRLAALAVTQTTRGTRTQP